MILSDIAIRQALDAQRIGITPFSDKDLKGASYDFHLAPHFRVFIPHNETCIDPMVNQQHLTTPYSVRAGDVFVLHPGQFALASSTERFFFGRWNAGRLEGKSSLARLGLIIHSAGFFDPGFNGHATLELANPTSLPIKLYPGMLIGQMAFYAVQGDVTPSKLYGGVVANSKYQHQGEAPAPSRYFENYPDGPPNVGVTDIESEAEAHYSELFDRFPDPEERPHARMMAPPGITRETYWDPPTASFPPPDGKDPAKGRWLHNGGLVKMFTHADPRLCSGCAWVEFCGALNPDYGVHCTRPRHGTDTDHNYEDGEGKGVSWPFTTINIPEFNVARADMEEGFVDVQARTEQALYEATHPKVPPHMGAFREPNWGLDEEPGDVLHDPPMVVGFDPARTTGFVFRTRDGRIVTQDEIEEALQERGTRPVIDLTRPWQVLTLPVEDFLIGMTDLGTPQEIQIVGAFANDPDDPTVRTAHRDTDLPPHRDGIYTQAIANMQGGTYVEKPNVDVVGMYCLRTNDAPCYTVFYEDEAGEKVITEVDLQAGQALVWDNRLWHGRRGAVGDRLLVRFWTTLPHPLP